MTTNDERTKVRRYERTNVLMNFLTTELHRGMHGEHED